MSEVYYAEALLAERLGVSQHALKDFRGQLKKNQWQKKEGAFYLSQPAVEKLLEKLGTPDFDCSDCLEKNGALPDVPVALVVHKVYPNPRLMLCRFPDKPNMVRVQCFNNVNFRPGMKINARPALNGLYRLEGRAPRFPGKW